MFKYRYIPSWLFLGSVTTEGSTSVLGALSGGNVATSPSVGSDPGLSPTSIFVALGGLT